MKYSLGFIFDQARDHVLLIQKARPARHRGKLNGIGGKVEPGKTFLQAMIRECWEETGISTEARSGMAALRHPDGRGFPHGDLRAVFADRVLRHPAR